DSESNDQEKEDNVNSTNTVNATSTNEVNATSTNEVNASTDDLNMPELEDIFYSDDDEDVGAKANMNNLDAFMHVRPIPATRIHKDHPVEQIIRDLNSSPQTRRMTKNLKEHEEPKKTLVDLPNGKRAIGTKWVFRNKKDERGIMIKNKVRIEVIRLFLAYASFKDFVVYQMDVKSAFLYGKIEEEVYVCQPPGLEDPDFPDRVYVDDIIFGSTKKKLCTEFEKMIHKKFQMSYMGELTFFLGLQVNHKEDEIFISQDKYVTEILKKFGFSDVKIVNTPLETHKPLLKDADGEDVDEHIFQVNPKVSHLHAVKIIFSDYAGASLDRKSTISRLKYVAALVVVAKCFGFNNHLSDLCGFQDLIASIEMLKSFKMDEKEIGVNTGDSKLMLLGLILLLLEKVNASRHNFLLLVFTDSHNMVAFLAKPTESKGFEQIMDLLNANPIKYALTVNPIIYTSCIEQFWATTKVETVNGEVQLHALVDRKKALEIESLKRRACEHAEKKQQGQELTSSKDYSRLVDLHKLFPLKMKGRYDDAQMFDTNVFNGEKYLLPEQTLTELRSAKPKVVVQEPVQSTTTTTPSTIPKAKSITFRDPGESTTRTTLTPISSNIKDKVKANYKLKKKNKQDLQERRLKKLKIANISWDNVQAMIEADRLLAERLQAREQEELTDEEKARLFIELLEKRKETLCSIKSSRKEEQATN
ncbi:putative ribonuclease H-like domain-containing protein, partial [Tanacetum coccineum]